MKKTVSALTAIGGFSVAVAVLSVSVTAGIVLLTPDPPSVRMTVAEAAAALRGQAGALDRREGEPPDGPPAPLLRAALAREMGRSPDAVRVIWLERLPPQTPTNVVVMHYRSAPGTASMPVAGTTIPRGGVIVSRRRFRSPASASSLPQLGGLMGSLFPTLPQPAFAASVRLDDGRWITVSPHRPLFGGWRLKVLSALAISLLLLAPLAWLFARRLTRPFRALAAAVESGGAPPRLDGPRELQEAAAAINQLRERLAAETEERTRMLTAVAHDLRTPLTSLRLRIESVAEPQRTRMVTDAERMSAMLQDVLNFARAAETERCDVPVRAVVRRIIDDMAGTVGRVALLDGAEHRVHVVDEGLRRALENLIRNALDYAGGGSVEISERGDTVRISVKDAGPGIPTADRARLLRPFERGDASRNRDTGGAGLGLSIVKAFADHNAGSIDITDGRDGGATVTLILPAAGHANANGLARRAHQT